METMLERRRRRRRQDMTLLEYLDTPESAGPEELIFGKLYAAESPTTAHQEIVGRLHVFLFAHLLECRVGSVWLAPLDVILDADPPLVVQPDLFVIRRDGAAIVDRKVYGPPDLVIEVLSPKPRIGTVEERVGWFREYGVHECWLVHQIERTVDVLQFSVRGTDRRRHAADEPIQSGVLPDFNRSLAAICG